MLTAARSGTRHVSQPANQVKHFKLVLPSVKEVQIQSCYCINADWGFADAWPSLQSLTLGINVTGALPSSWAEGFLSLAELNISSVDGYLPPGVLW